MLDYVGIESEGDPSPFAFMDRSSFSFRWKAQVLQNLVDCNSSGPLLDIHRSNSNALTLSHDNVPCIDSGYPDKPGNTTMIIVTACTN